MADVPVLAGELGLLSLFDLGQLLMLNGTTGALVITREGRRSFLYFDRGQIVNALDDTYREGEGAAYKIFTWKDGHFEFRPDTTAGSTAISEGTEGLMMEAARRMDEASAEVGESDGAVEKLTRRAGALDALREAFQSVASEAGSLPEADHEAGGSPFALLRDASDALLFRPGHVPRLLQAGRWRSAGKLVLDPAAFDQLRTRLLEGVRSAGATGSTARNALVQTSVVTGDDQRAYSVTRVAGAHEALWVRAAGLSPPDSSTLIGELALLRAMLSARSGLLLVGGPDAESADRMLHACVALLARERGGTMLLLADHGRWHHRDENGALLRTQSAEAPELIRMLAPTVVAHDTACAQDSLASLTGAPLVIAAVVAPDAASLLSRWCARVGRRWGDGVEAQLAGGKVGLLHASRPTADGRQAFTAQRYALSEDGTGVPSEANEEAEVAAPLPPVEPVAEESGATPPVSPPIRTDAEPSSPKDPFAALAAELTRTLRKAA